MAKVFQILVPDNTLFSRIISCENQVTELFVIDRSDKKFVAEHSAELNKPALYILVNRDKRQLYVGETDDSIKRLKNHEAKDFWTEAIVFHSTGDTLSTTEVRWLEAKTYEALKELGYYDLSENKQVPQQPPLKRNQIYTLEPIFEEAKNYICAAGFDIFLKSKDELEISLPTPAKEPEQDSKHLFFCTRGGSNAQGYFVEKTEEFVVLAGSELRSGECDSLKPQSIEKRKAFIEANCAQSKGKIFLKTDYTFPSPSAAAKMVAGGSSNGWTRWKDANGKKLEDVYRIAGNSVIISENPLSDQLAGRVKLSLNGKGEYTKGLFVWHVIKTYLDQEPQTTFKELQVVFPQSLIFPWNGWPMLQPDLEYAQSSKYASRYTRGEGRVLSTCDGVKFMVCNQWDTNNLWKVLDLIPKLGMTYQILK
jgi:GIY-YIG catalytic domain.